MRKACLPVSLTLVLLAAAAGAMFAVETSVVSLPKGTALEKLGPGHFRFKLPMGCVIEVNGLRKQDGIFVLAGDCGIKDAAGKPIAMAREGILRSGPPIHDLSRSPLDKIPREDYLKIDDDITWLPARIEIQANRIFSRSAMAKLAPPPQDADIR